MAEWQFLASDETKATRLSICAACEHRRFLTLPVVGPVPFCGRCKCQIDTKAALRHSSCPERKWPP